LLNSDKAATVQAAKKVLLGSGTWRARNRYAGPVDLTLPLRDALAQHGHRREGTRMTELAVPTSAALAGILDRWGSIPKFWELIEQDARTDPWIAQLRDLLISHREHQARNRAFESSAAAALEPQAG
jgi:hypothetical protein